RGDNARRKSRQAGQRPPCERPPGKRRLVPGPGLRPEPADAGRRGAPVLLPIDFNHPYGTVRTPVMGRRGMVATSPPLAAQIGLRILQEGGNAADAAVAAAAALTVLEPTSNGIGGDAFALVWDGRRLHGLNASGRAPAVLTPD